jgi:F0F1-type ATP synthase assembly protein I
MPFNRPIPDRKPGDKTSMGVQGLVQAEKVVQIALVLPSAVLIGWLGGAWLAGRLHQPWITLAGFILGSIAGMVSAIRMAISYGANPKTENTNGNGTDKENPGGQP